MKEMGSIVIRITHNPASSILLDLSAKMGLLIQEEALITWYGGRKNMIMVAFEEEALTDAKAGRFLVQDYDLRITSERGKNTPAIFMWSLGMKSGSKWRCSFIEDDQTLAGKG